MRGKKNRKKIDERTRGKEESKQRLGSGLTQEKVGQKTEEKKKEYEKMKKKREIKKTNMEVNTRK